MSKFLTFCYYIIIDLMNLYNIFYLSQKFYSDRILDGKKQQPTTSYHNTDSLFGPISPPQQQQQQLFTLT